MAEIINLRLQRKRKARAEAERAAAENRARFGRTKAEKQLENLERTEARQRLDGLRREPPDDSRKD